jgi:hypothetical protein
MPHSVPARLLFLACWLLCFTAPSHAQSLKITSTPPGAEVELDGVAAGTTPFEKNFPGGISIAPIRSLASAWSIPWSRASLSGFATREIALTQGPMQWIDFHGRNHGQYWLFKSDRFEVDLDPVTSTFTGAVTASLSPEAAPSQPELSLEEIVRRTKPAVVCPRAWHIC